MVCESGVPTPAPGISASFSRHRLGRGVLSQSPTEVGAVALDRVRAYARLLAGNGCRTSEGSLMYVAAIHKISDPEKFWSSADPNGVPSDISLHSSYPNEDGTRAVCLWEGESVESIRSLVDGMAGDSATNEFFEVNEQHAGTQGLPRAAARAT